MDEICAVFGYSVSKQSWKLVMMVHFNLVWCLLFETNIWGFIVIIKAVVPCRDRFFFFFLLWPRKDLEKSILDSRLLN